MNTSAIFTNGCQLNIAQRSPIIIELFVQTMEHAQSFEVNSILVYYYWITLKTKQICVARERHRKYDMYCVFRHY